MQDNIKARRALQDDGTIRLGFFKTDGSEIETKPGDIMWLEFYPIHFDAPPREPGSVEKRTDFMYMDGHGTFYRFDEDYYDESFLHAQKEDRINLVLYNLNTDQLDEITFELTGYEKVGDNYIYVKGFIADIEDCFRIQIDFNRRNPLKSRILVYASARPWYGFY